jgi:dihydrofolate synthase/folylpolyglutamate synthase
VKQHFSLPLQLMMNYQQTLEFLFIRLPMFSRIGAAAYKKDLTNTIKLCEALGNPHLSFKSIHIAGTNGKGSTSHMLAAVLQQSGYKTGLYTSPHLKDFRERIRIDGIMCNEAFVVDFTQQIMPLIDEIEPSFFEITVAMAFAWFAQQKVDIAVIETGLGGRLDSTNIITPILSIITNIGMDHMNMLGNTLTAIAGEKAGIIKPTIPVVIGETLPETKTVFEQKAASVKAPIIYAQQERWITDFSWEHSHLSVTVSNQANGEHHAFQLDLPGLYQTNNLLTILEAVHQLKKQGYQISDDTLTSALANVKKLTGLRGRWDVIDQHPTIVLDVAHNEDGIRQLIQQIELQTFTHLHIIMGMVKDKEITKMLDLLPKQADYYFTKAQIPRALAETDLQLLATEKGLQGHCFAEVNLALAAAKQRAHKNDLIIVCGSVFVVGEVNFS